MESRSASLFLIFILPILAAAASRKGGWEQIPNVLENVHVQKLGNFAVDQYNTQSKAELEINVVDKAELQVVVGGTKYRLVVEVTNHGYEVKYEAIVWETAGGRFKKLTSFKMII